MVFQQGWSAESILGIAQVLRTLRFFKSMANIALKRCDQDCQ